MALDQQLDALELKDLNLPYNHSLAPLNDEPRIVSGLNTYVTYGGTIAKRPCAKSIANTTLNGRVDRLWIYETMETTPVVYLLASVFVSTVWVMYYIKLSAGTPAWTSLGTLRDLNASTMPHEGVAARGKFFIKGFPNSSEKLGTVVFDGTGGTVTVRFWGLIGPTTAARISGVVPRITAAITASATSMALSSASGLPATPFNMQLDYELVTVTNLVSTTATITRAVSGTIAAAHAAQTVAIYRDWSASDHPITVYLYWRYSYAYKTITGQISNRAPVETNPDLLPSATGPFINLKPKITVQGHSDTTNVPTIVIYRTTDGGGTFYKLEEITNTGSGAITYIDDSLGSGGSGTTFNDPVPDESLSANSLAPSLTSNSPPPTVLAPLVTGTDTPAASTPLAYYQGRVWFGIGNLLFYSSLEELPDGVPEESFATGLKGNFRFQHPLKNLHATNNGLYIFTEHDTALLTGSNLETFNVTPVLGRIGAAAGHPRAITKFKDSVVFLTQDYRVGIVQGNNFKSLSDPLVSDIVDDIALGYEVGFTYFADLDKEWLIVNTFDKTTTVTSRQFVYDLKKSSDMGKDFWFTPWNIPAVACAAGRINETQSRAKLVWFLWDNTANSLLVEADTTVGDDDLPGASTQTVSLNFVTNLFQIPHGNHVNTLRAPGFSPSVYALHLDRTKYTSDNDPTVTYFRDDLWTDPKSPVSPESPASQVEDSKGYKTLIYPIQEVAKRFAFKVTKNSTTELFELQSFAILWEPEAGRGN